MTRIVQVSFSYSTCLGIEHSFYRNWLLEILAVSVSPSPSLEVFLQTLACAIRRGCPTVLATRQHRVTSCALDGQESAERKLWSGP